MPTSSAKYTLTHIKQLIELNGDIVNFNLTFTVKSNNKEPFYLVAVDQSLLDSEENLDYKLVDTGIISGNIISDNNIHNNFYLVLKSKDNNKVNVDVTIEIEEIQPNPHHQQINEQDISDSNIHNTNDLNNLDIQQYSQYTENYSSQSSSVNFFTKYFKYILLGLVISVIVYLIYKYYTNNIKFSDTVSPDFKLDEINPIQIEYPPAVNLSDYLSTGNDLPSQSFAKKSLTPIFDSNLSDSSKSSLPEIRPQKLTKRFSDDLNDVLNNLDLENIDI